MKRTAIVLPLSPRVALRRERDRAARWLRAQGRRASRRAVDDFLWSRWYRLADDVCDALAEAMKRSR